MTQTQEMIHDLTFYRIILPRLFIPERIFRTVQAVDRRKYTILQPAYHQLVVAVAVHMSSNVMAPPAITDV